mmetsp:Transcript_17369/g.52475  ORF Transcript_17369/g.52475 Transcript_17369/m.52475 type:complete len:300 (-) Transcript_17369:101-1000(-)|eukprot:scaffold268962_cov33-Tisochrysis_lutea.AAC.1
MLAADKDRLVAALKQNALSLRQRELEYYVERYSNIATQASIVAGFAFDSLVEIEISEEMRQDIGPSGRWNADLRWMESVFYGAASLTMALGLYTTCVASFATVYGHRLALQGPTGSVERAVAVMMKQRQTIFVTYGLALSSLIVAAITMAWIKMGLAAAFVTAIFGILFVGLVRKHQQMKFIFRIPREHIVQGDLRLLAGVSEVDVSRLEAGYGDSVESAPQAAAPLPPAPTAVQPGLAVITQPFTTTRPVPRPLTTQFPLLTPVRERAVSNAGDPQTPLLLTGPGASTMPSGGALRQL